MDDTEIFIDNTLDEVIETPVYTLTLKSKTHPDYRCTTQIIEWIQTNLTSLTDDQNNTIFSKVNYGYNSETLKGFGRKPVADVYIDHLSYTTDFDDNRPDTVTSFIICYLKGNMNNAYVKACELTDFLIQEFEEETSFRELDNVVKGTSVNDVRLEIIPSGKVYGVLCAFELEHKLY